MQYINIAWFLAILGAPLTYILFLAHGLSKHSKPYHLQRAIAFSIHAASVFTGILSYYQNLFDGGEWWHGLLLLPPLLIDAGAILFVMFPGTVAKRKHIK
jgi:hypothetical protein